MTDDEAVPAAELAQLRRENELLRCQNARLKRELTHVAPLIEQVRQLGCWDFAPYAVCPDESWVAVDRAKAAALMSALAHVDHWHPWTTTIEPRPKP